MAKWRGESAIARVQSAAGKGGVLLKIPMAILG